MLHGFRAPNADRRWHTMRLGIRVARQAQSPGIGTHPYSGERLHSRPACDAPWGSCAWSSCDGTPEMCRERRKTKNMNTQNQLTTTDGPAGLLALDLSSAFLSDVCEARRIWGERSAWERIASGECRADRTYKGLMWSAAHEGHLLGSGPGGAWSESKQHALDAAQIEYEMRTHLSIFKPNGPSEPRGKAAPKAEVSPSRVGL
jgi:hypothetical protein